MDMMNWILVGIVLVVAVVGAIVYYRKRQKQMYEGFEQIAAMLKQVPKQKKQNFLLFMFRESARAGKKKDVNIQGKLNDPKYMEVQLLQMGLVLKDRTRTKDKKMKQALQMYDTYLRWEKAKGSKSGAAA